MQHRVKTISIKGITLRYLSLILLFALAGIVLITAVGFYSSHEVVRRHENFEREVLSRDLGDLVGFYRNIAQSAARRQEVMDILEFGDVERAVMWANELRSIVPESIGVALIDRSGVVLGEPLQLNLGEQCVNDLKLMLAGEPVDQPPVHSGMLALRHFDVVTRVTSNGESLGLLFMSFSLDVLQNLIEQRAGGKQYLMVEDSNGNILAEVGERNGRKGSLSGPPAAMIPGTDWRMHYLGPGWRGSHLILMAISIGGMIFIVTLTITLFLSGRLVRFFNDDLQRIRGLLDEVHLGSETAGKVVQPRLRETTTIMEDVAGLVRKIEQANTQLREQSMHDSLTGLLNRRAFDEALLHYIGLASRGVTSRLVMLDLDLFKQVNDRYGHVIGDEVLISLAETLLERCRTADILARVGGDEFALIMPIDTGDIDEWFHDVDKMFSQRQELINTGKGIEPKCRISAGSIIIDNTAGRDVKALMKMVDKKLYEAKRTGRASIRY